MKFKIKDFRMAISLLNYIRNDFSGSTRDEQLLVDLRERYARPIAHLEYLLGLTPIRFAKDIENAQHAIDCANAQILRNEERQRQVNVEPVHPRLANSGDITVWVEESATIPREVYAQVTEHLQSDARFVQPVFVIDSEDAVSGIVVHVDFKTKRILN